MCPLSSLRYIWYTDIYGTFIKESLCSIMRQRFFVNDMCFVIGGAQRQKGDNYVTSPAS